MKFAKLSIAALAVVGFSSSALALDLSGVTAKPYVKTKLYYETIAKDGVGGAGEDLFSQTSASGQAMLTGGITGALDSCWGYGFEYNIVDTLGLENNIVSGVRMAWDRDSIDEGGLEGALSTKDWASQAYVAYSPCNTILSNTTFKMGRQFLDTPFAFTEKWNLAPNSFDAIVALNQDIKNVTLVGAYVGRGNGEFVQVTRGDDFARYGTETIEWASSKLAAAGAIDAATKKTFDAGHQGDGAYAVGILTNLVDGLPINLWYYDVQDVADAMWADAAYTLKLGDDMSVGLGAQYGTMMPKSMYESTLKAFGVSTDDSAGYAVKASGKIGMFNVMAAYSTVDDDGITPLANTATGFKKTKLYTAGIYTDGTGVAVPGSDAFKVKASANVDGIGKFIAQYVSCENDVTNAAMQNVDEIDVIYATKLAGIGVKAIYMNRDVTPDGGKKGVGMDTDHVRLILSKNF